MGGAASPGPDAVRPCGGSDHAPGPEAAPRADVTPAPPSSVEPPWTADRPTDGVGSSAREGDGVSAKIEGLEDVPREPQRSATIPSRRAAAPVIEAFVRRSGEQLERLAASAVDSAEIALAQMAKQRTIRPLYVVGALAGARAMLVPLLAAIALTAAMVGGGDHAAEKHFPKEPATAAALATAEAPATP